MAPDYVSASRRTSLFNGYTGFATYSSISQGLDEITYGGRLSRRGSVTNIAAANDYSLPTLLATYEATRAAVASTSSSGANNAQTSGRDSESRQASRQVSRQQSHKAEESANAAPVAAPAPPPPKSKLKRRVSFTDKEPVIIARKDEEGADSAEPRKPRRKKEKDPSGATIRQTPRKKREKSADPAPAAQERRTEVDVARERRRSQPVGDELFEQVSTKLKEFEIQQQQETVGATAEAEVTAAPVKVAYAVRYPEAAFEDLSSACSGISSSESSPPQKPRQNRNSGIFAASSSSSSSSPAGAAAADPFCAGATSVQYREKPAGATAAAPATSSRAGSKRNSLDGKTVQGLAQDLAAECAKAYALMESSLSKLSSEFGGGPFGMASKSKVRSTMTLSPEE